MNHKHQHNSTITFKFLTYFRKTVMNKFSLSFNVFVVLLEIIINYFSK